MSLWYKEIDKIKYDDIDAFCQVKTKEGIRLDYKAEIPNDLAKIVASFANTLGGIILLGVDADQRTNEPIWEQPKRGMPAANGIEERITSICRDKIYPAVRPEISPIIDSPKLPGHVLAVVRVPESPEAPHAIQNRRRVYERIESQSRPYDFADLDIDRLQYLLSRREMIVEGRKKSLDLCLRRGRHLIGPCASRMAQDAGIYKKGRTGVPLRWASVVPYFPWRDLCSRKTCCEKLGSFTRRTPCTNPDGALAIVDGRSSYYSVSTKGHIFGMDCSRIREGAMCLEDTYSFAADLYKFAKEFLADNQVENPSFLNVELGVLDSLGMKMKKENYWAIEPEGFVDDSFHADRTAGLQEFIDGYMKVANKLFDDLAYGFGVVPYEFP